MGTKVAKINYKKINTSNTAKGKIFDVAIVGAGFTGLSAALVLGRYLCPTLAVNEKAQRTNLSVSTAAYSVIEEIENYNRIGGLKNEISRPATQIYAMNQICAPRNKASPLMQMLMLI
jgi:L-2-hydroxyglutarate oxidase LhgO